MNFNYRHLVIAAAAVVVLGGGLWLHLSALDTRNQRITALDKERVTLESQLVDTGLEDEVAELRDKLAHREAVLGIEEGVGSLMRTLSADLHDLELSNRSLTSGNTRQEGVLKQIPLSLSFKGSYADTFELMSRLQDYDRLVRVEQLTINREGRSLSDEVMVSAKLLTFARRDKEQR